jgi:hypothetical protein
MSCSNTYGSRIVFKNGLALLERGVYEQALVDAYTKLRDIGATLRADVPSGRLALGALLGDRRIRIYRDGRIEGAVDIGGLPAPKLETASGAGRPGGTGEATPPWTRGAATKSICHSLSRRDACIAALEGHLVPVFRFESISKVEMTRLTRTSRSALDRLLDPENESVS